MWFMQLGDGHSKLGKFRFSIKLKLRIGGCGSHAIGTYHLIRKGWGIGGTILGDTDHITCIEILLRVLNISGIAFLLKPTHSLIKE